MNYVYNSGLATTCFGHDNLKSCLDYFVGIQPNQRGTTGYI